MPFRGLFLVRGYILRLASILAFLVILLLQLGLQG